MCCCPNCFIFGHWDIFYLATIFLGMVPLLLSFYPPTPPCLPSFLLGMARYCMLILYISCPSPRLTTSLRHLASFYWRMVLEMKIWALGVLAATRVFLLDPLSWQRNNTSICILTRMYKNPYKFLYVIICRCVKLNMIAYLVSNSNPLPANFMLT